MGRLTDSLRAALRSSGAAQQSEQMDVLDQAGGTDTVERVLEQAVGSAAIDPDDPDFEPVEGIGVDDYARISRALVDAGQGIDDDRRRAIVAEHGVDWPTWTRVAECWNERIMRNRAVGLRYSATFVDRG